MSLQRGRILLLILLCLGAAPARSDPFLPDWSAIHTWPFPLTANGWENPVLTRSNLSGQPASLVADPCLWRNQDGWLLFFELYYQVGRIGLARSENGYDWTFDRIVLEPGYHLSYPCVFQADGEYYMVVEAAATQMVPLFKAANFPYDWTQVGVLATGRAFADPTILRRGDTWWLFVSRSTNDVCYLYYADSLSGIWTEHPQSPVVTGAWRSRPAGHMVALPGSQLLRVAQDCDPTYGEGVRVFAVDALTRTTYAEHQIAESPVLFRSGSGWNARGMHTCDLWWTGDLWLAAVDGMNPSGIWSIGLYWGRAAPGSAPVVDAPAAWRVVPNPFRAGDEVEIVAAAGGEQSCDLLEIFNPTGRLLKKVTAAASGGSFRFRWHGGSAGDPPTPGVYLLRASSHGQVRWSGKGIALR